MHILFLDESTPQPNVLTDKYSHFSLGGVIISEQKWIQVHAALLEIKGRWGINGEIKWRWFSMHNRSPKNPLLHLNWDDRKTLRAQIYEIINTFEIILLAAVAYMPAVLQCGYIQSGDDLYFQCYKVMTERFQYFLQDLPRDAGRQNLGIIVCDSRDHGHDRKLRDAHHKLYNGQVPYSSNYPNLIEGLFISPSHQSIGIQIADMVVGSVCHYYSTREEWCFTPIRDCFRKEPAAGIIIGRGIVHVPTTWGIGKTPGGLR